MRLSHSFGTAAFCGLILFSTAYAAETVQEIRARMDKNAATFQSMTGTLDRVQHTAILNEDEKDSASVRLKKTSSGLHGYVEFAEPNRRIIGFQSRQLQVYYPKTKTVEIYDLGKHGSEIDQFLLLGFGISGKDLEKSYEMRVTGTDNIGGKPATRLELVPKSQDALEYLKKVELWIPQGASYPVQEKIYKNSQDYILISYSDVKINPPLSDSDLELHVPAGVKKVYPQK